MDNENYWTKSRNTLRQAALTRRSFLRAGGVGMAGLAGAALIGCGGDDDEPAGSGGAGGTATATGTGTGTGEATASAVPGGTLRVGTVQDLVPNTMPATSTPGNSAVYKGVLDSLVRFRPDEYVADPQLAESWEFSPDYTQLTFKLKQGVNFHNGNPFTAEAVIHNLENAANPDVGSSLVRFASWITAMETPDDHTVALTFDAPRPSIMDLFEDLHILEPSNFERAQAGEEIIGTGPFRFGSWQPGTGFNLVRNDDYHMDNKSLVDEVRVSIIPDQSAQVISLRAGDIDIALEPLPNEAQSIEGDSDFQLLSANPFTTAWYTGIDLNAPGMQDERVRQAVAWAIDRENVVRTSLFGFGKPISLMWPEGSPAYDAELTNYYSYNLDEAKKLLDAAGVSDLTMPYTVTENYPATHGIAEILQADLATLGINAELARVPHAQYLPPFNEKRMLGLWGGVLGFLSMNPATLFNASIAVRPGNPSNYESEEYADLVTEVSTKPIEELADTYKRLNQHFVEAAFVIPVVSDEKPTVAAANLQGFIRNRKGAPLWEYVSLG